MYGHARPGDSIFRHTSRAHPDPTESDRDLGPLSAVQFQDCHGQTIYPRADTREQLMPEKRFG